MNRWICACILALPMVARADLDPASRDTLIEKLNRVNLNLAPEDTSKVGVTLRLADLLAERARIDSMKDLESGCTVCTAGAVDREKALHLYQDVLDRVPEVNRGQVMVQVGHLLELTGQEKAALEFYAKTVNQAPNPAAVAESQLSLAEIYFKKNQYSQAEAHYNEVLKIASASSRGLAAYRLAWCRLNQGNLNGAVDQFILVLKTPDLLTRNGVAGSQTDRQFQEEVSRDLATVLARRAITESDVESLYQLSPDSAQLANTTLLAAETERLGKKRESLMVWKYVYNKQKQAPARLEALVHMAPAHLDAGQKTDAIGDLEASLSLWSELKGCGKPDCSEIRKLLRQLVINWNQLEKKAPSEELQKAYSLYLGTFANEVDMAEWAAVVAKTRHDWAAADQFHRLAIENLKVKNGPELEAALLAYIETAEASNEASRLAAAQDLYLATTVQKTKFYEVRYQKAHALYSVGNAADAANQLFALAKDATGPKQLRQQAAELALDALGQLKDDRRLQEWAGEFANWFEQGQSDFYKTQQKSILTEAAALATSGQYDKGWATLARFDAAKAAPEDRITVLKNKVLIAEKTGRLADGSAAANELLMLKATSVEDRQFALGRIAYFAEMQFDFATALKATEKLEQSQSNEQKFLKLAIFADLAGQSSSLYYSQYLKATADHDARVAVSAELVRKSKDQGREIEAQRPILEKSPELLARLYTEAYAKSASDKLLLRAVSDAKVKSTEWGRVLARTAFLQNLVGAKAIIAPMTINSQTQALLAKSIKARAAQLAKVESLVGNAIESGDWTSQLVSLDLLAKESDRFYQDLLSLPIPEGLNGDEEQQYMSLLGQQAAPYKSKADQAKAKVGEFWSRPNWKSEIEKSVASNAEFSRLLEIEIQALAAAAPAGEKDFFAKVVINQASQAGPTLAEIEGLTNEVRSKPFDRGALEKLLSVERRAKNFAMIQYLEGRLKLISQKESNP